MTSSHPIAAVATPPGISALGIIRVSGDGAIQIVSAIFPKKDLTKVKSHTLHHGQLIHNGVIVDDVLISVFKAPNTYTGEDLVEISCHGSPYILKRVMEALVQEGARPAGPGEFTQRAFLNGKLDLSQAEAVADLIASESEASHSAAIEGLRGGFSQKIKSLRSQLLQFASLVELELDFAEEDVEFANRPQLLTLLSQIYAEVSRLAESFQLGNAIKSGVKVVIAGRPNAGKSTLLNALLQEERAIVSDIPGTTRDTIEDVLVLNGIPFRFIDTAGLRSTTDTLESIGIERTMDKLREANLIVYLFDVKELNSRQLQDELSQLPPDKFILVAGNKTDKDPGVDFEPQFNITQEHLFISGKTHQNLDALQQKLIDALQLPAIKVQDTLITNLRHFTALTNILKAIENIQQGILNGVSTDLLAVDIHVALHEMGEITGEITNDEILGNIFSQFCIGK
jgi:tRNA modification GTPase